MDRSQCAICVDFLTCADSTAIPCGHTFHSECIKRWKEQSSTCPQCRVKFTKPIKLYFELSAADREAEDPAALKNQLTELNLKLRCKDSSIDALTKEKKKHEDQLKAKEKEVKTQRTLLDDALGTNDALKKQLTYMEKYKTDAKKARSDLVALQKTIESYQNIQALINSESRDIEDTIRNFSENSDSFNQITTSYVFFKKEYDRLKESKRALENENKTQRRKADSYAQQLRTVSNDMKQLDSQNKALTEKVAALEKAQAQAASMKRLYQSPNPKPTDGKRRCFVADNSLVLFDEENTEENDSGNFDGSTHDLDQDLDQEEESIKIADEFGLDYVATTSLGPDKKAPLKDITKLTKNSFASKMKHSGLSNKGYLGQNEKSDLPHFKRGFNGMGGQSKTLVIPKRTANMAMMTSSGSFMKSTTEKKSSFTFNKIPKNNSKITQFCSGKVDLT